MVFQQPNPFPMSIFDNVAYSLAEQRPAARASAGAGAHPSSKRPSIDALRRAGLYDEVAGDLDRSALRLSGGQQQRLCIARALAAEPEVLLLDEPCSALDPISTATIEELIVGLRESVAIVIVTHNLQQAFRVADHVAFMHLGELVEYGPSEQVFDRPVRAAHARLRQRGVRVSASARRAGARARRACLALGLTGCETTAGKERPARTPSQARHARPAAGPDDRRGGAPQVKVLSAAVVRGSEGAAAVVTVRNDSASDAARRAARDRRQERRRADAVSEQRRPDWKRR